jgi:hypothetical protein
MTKPETIEDAERILADLASADAPSVMMTILSELVDLACAGGMPASLRDNWLHNFKKLKFYQACIARIVLKNRKLTT